MELPAFRERAPWWTGGLQTMRNALVRARARSGVALRRWSWPRTSLGVAALALLATAPSCTLLGSGRTSPLVGRIQEVGTGRFVSEPELLRALARPRYVLLGEVHDNAEHHRIQARIVAALAAGGRRPAVVLEMIPRERSDALAEALRGGDAQPGDLRRAVDWDRSGWPAWELYAPVFEAALAGGLPLAAGDLARADREALARGAAQGPGAHAIPGLDLAAPAPAEQRERLADAIRRGHCDLLPEEAVPAMVEFQRARDAQLARSLVEAATPDGALLIAGAGHVRRDVAVPWWLGRFAPDEDVVGVALVEVGPDDVDPSAALADEYGGSPPFDYLWFTRPAPREDPCEELRRRFAGRGEASRRERAAPTRFSMAQRADSRSWSR